MRCNDFCRIPIFACLILSPWLACAAEPADEKLEHFFQEYLERQFQMRPLEATLLGDHRFDDRLDDISPLAREEWLKHARTTLESLPKAITYSNLSRDGQINFEIFQAELVRNIWLAENTHPFEEDPRIYGNYISDSIYVLLTQSTLPQETNLKNALARMKEIPRIVATARETLRETPRSVLETAIRQNQGAILFFEREIFELVPESPRLDDLRLSVVPVVAALQQHQSFLESCRTVRANEDWRLGREKFGAKLELVLDAGLTADQVLADAEAEFARVQRDLYLIAKQLWGRYFPKESLPPEDAEGRRETIAQVTKAVSQEHGEPEQLVAETRATVDRIKTFIREHDLLRLPEPDRCQIFEMPEFRRGNSIAYLEAALPLDPQGASLFAVSPPPRDWDAARIRSFLEEYNRHMLQILTIHEAYPGHYVQLEYANRSRSMIRRALQSGVFAEGWAVYTEQMMLDQGYGAEDLALRLNQLKFYLRTVTNAILDHRMHCTEMTDDEALRLLTQEAYQSEGEARLKIIRAKQSSVQLSTYFVGRMAFYRARQQIQRELGETFELGRYHEAVLDHGSVPVKYIPELTRSRLSNPR